MTKTVTYERSTRISGQFSMPAEILLILLSCLSFKQFHTST